MRVLIVDDDPLMIAFVNDILENSGSDFMTEIAQNGFEVGIKIHIVAPDAVLLNFMMPDINGLRKCSLIKGDAAYQSNRHYRRWVVSANQCRLIFINELPE
jgi:CheY-like chemotaxis protein